MQDSKQLYFAWTEFQRRQVSMAQYCDFETIFMPVERRQTKVAKTFTYLRNGWDMLRVLRKQRPAVVWLQLPQVPLLWVALIYKWAFARQAIIIADCHNAMFRPPWSKVPLGLSMLSNCDVVLAHNPDVMESAVNLGVDRQRMMVVEDPPASFPVGAAPFALSIDLPRPWLVFPASFAADEPIAELLAAAGRTPDVAFLITGNVKNCRDPKLVAQAPDNVRFLGFLSRNDFEALIQACDAIIAFTRFDGIQLSVCGEAVGASKPMLTSDTVTLRRQYPTGTVFVNSADPDDIVEGIRRLQRDEKILCEQMSLFHAQLRDDWVRDRANPLGARIALVNTSNIDSAIPGTKDKK
jgi:hypothetical protein